MSDHNPSDYMGVARIVLSKFGKTNEKLSRMNTVRKVVECMGHTWYVQRENDKIFVFMSKKYNAMNGEPFKETLVYTYNISS